MNDAVPAGANGVLALNLGPWALWHQAKIVGGPYRNKQRDTFGVCLLEQAHGQPEVWLPIRDFSVPTSPAAVDHAIRATLTAALDGKQVWVGCMGGFGRTGLFLALLARVAGVKDPVGYVREHYCAHAVETKEQQAYVEFFPVEGLRRWLFWQACDAQFWRPWQLVSGWMWPRQA